MKANPDRFIESTAGDSWAGDSWTGYMDYMVQSVANTFHLTIIIVDHPPAIVNPLSVSIQSSGKQRLILDLRHVNLYIFKQKFKCEDLSVALKVMSKGYY